VEDGLWPTKYPLGQKNCLGTGLKAEGKGVVPSSKKKQHEERTVEIRRIQKGSTNTQEAPIL